MRKAQRGGKGQIEENDGMCAIIMANKLIRKGVVFVGFFALKEGQIEREGMNAGKIEQSSHQR